MLTLVTVATGLAYWLGLAEGSCCLGPLACTLSGVLLLWVITRPTREIRAEQERMALRRRHGSWRARRERARQERAEHEWRRHLVNIKHVWDTAPTDAH